jgi:hypothetical protein
MVGLCTGIFVVATVNAGQRDLRLGLAAALVLTAAVPISWAFSRALRAGLRSRAAGRQGRSWVHAAHAAVWLLSVTAAVPTVFGTAVRVAVIAIVPIVLLAPPALIGIRTLLRRRPEHDRAVPPIAS